jgi:SAM-dependent methyltransferase
MFGSNAEGASAGFRFNFQFTEEGSIQPKPEDEGAAGGAGAPAALRPPVRVAVNAADPALHKIVKKVSSVEELALGETTVRKWTVPSQALQECLDLMAEKQQDEFGKVSEVIGSSDLAPGVYEGGFKLWEGAADLVTHLQETEKLHGVSYAGKKVLELGCGHGVPGIYLWKQGAEVHLQDYNSEVLELLTIPNARLNATEENKEAMERVEFYAGDWGLLTELLPRHAYDVILTAETIYNVNSLPRLFALIKHCLKPPHGVCYVAAKSYYFSVGGGCRQFEEMVNRDGLLETSVEKVIKDGSSNVREIIKVSFKKQDP